MKNLRILLSVLLIFAVGFFASSIVVNAISETFPLAEDASVSRIVSVDVGDRIVGDFKISNMPTWRDSYTGDPTTYRYEFKIAKIANPVDEVVFEVDQQSQGSFDIACAYTGNYILRFNVGSGIGLGNAQATLNYNVIKPSSNDQSTSSKLEISPLIFTGIMACVFILVACGGYAFSKLRRKTQSA
jgi:hypothetical protein